MDNLDEQGEKNSVEMGWQWLDGKRTGWKMLEWFKGKGQGASESAREDAIKLGRDG